MASPLLLAVLASGVGVVVESAQIARDEESLTPPGRMVVTESGSWRIHCEGEGAPTVLLEAGLGESGMTWADLQAPLAREGRACSYDRAGYGWSSPATAHDALARSEQLHALLAAAPAQGSYILVAHSFGSLVSRLFAASYPDEVPGLVLIDPTNELTLTAAGVPVPQMVVSSAQSLASRVGLLRPFASELIESESPGAPSALIDLAPFLFRASAIDTSSHELANSVTSAEQVSAHPVRPSLPVVVMLTDDSLNDETHFTTIAEDVTITHAAGAPHYFHYARPELVIDSVRGLADSQ